MALQELLGDFVVGKLLRDCRGVSWVHVDKQQIQIGGKIELHSAQFAESDNRKSLALRAFREPEIARPLPPDDAQHRLQIDIGEVGQIAHGRQNICFPGDLSQADAKFLSAFEAAHSVQPFIIPRSPCDEGVQISS